VRVLVTGGGQIDSTILNYEYHVEGKTLREVAQDFGMSTTPIRRMMRIYGIPRRRNGFTYRVRIGPSSSLCYLLGILLGDGYVGRKRFCLEVADIEFLRSFSEAAKHLGFSPKYEQRMGVFGVIHKATCNCKQFTDWYRQQTVSSILRFVRNYPLDFIRGFYESEGYIRQRLAHEHYPTIEIVMINSNKELLEGIVELLRKVNVSSRLRKSIQFGGFGKKHGLGKPIYTLVILGSSKDKLHFIKKLNPCIKNLRSV